VAHPPPSPLNKCVDGHQKRQRQHVHFDSSEQPTVRYVSPLSERQEHLGMPVTPPRLLSYASRFYSTRPERSSERLKPAISILDELERSTAQRAELHKTCDRERSQQLDALRTSLEQKRKGRKGRSNTSSTGPLL
jgi:hypothetical protein